MLALTMTRLKAGAFALTVTKSDGVTPLDITGMDLYFHAVVGGIEINKDSSGNGISITNASHGLASLLIAAADTEAISEGGIHVGDCELTLVNGTTPYELNKGTLTVNSNVGEP